MRFSKNELKDGLFDRAEGLVKEFGPSLENQISSPKVVAGRNRIMR